jgi:hypothetical protein
MAPGGLHSGDWHTLHENPEPNLDHHHQTAFPSRGQTEFEAMKIENK